VGLNLHTHLEGWVRPETAADLAASMGVPPPDGGWEHALRMTEPADLTVFLAHVAAAYPVLGSAEAMRRVAREAVEDAAADRCDYLELRFGPSTHARPGFGIPDVIAATCAGLEEGSRATGLPVGLVVCLLRHLDDATNLAIARAAADAAGDGVVGLDVAGDELLYPSLEPYREPYRIAAGAGLGLTAHAAVREKSITGNSMPMRFVSVFIFIIACGQAPLEILQIKLSLADREIIASQGRV